jgi:hypothetical protein
MKPRPTSITVISWILIVVGVISLITSTAALNNPMAKALMARSPIPLPVQYAMLYVGLLVTIISGVAMLKALNWGRLLYVIWSAAGFVINFATSPIKIAIIPGFLLYLVVVFFLFRPKANQFFAGTYTQNSAQNT